MLHKSFKPAKCKTTLNLAKSRIKLMKNKKDVQIKQLKRELAQLLQSGQDQTARIRVEHVVREQKTMAAYELIELYCELIVARLPIIETQKNCPLDLKEAITSLLFAAPRCGDIPELQDARKHFTAKYGKEFVAAAIELRPQCGVSRNLVEKLSVNAPDGPTKVKILTAIAEEHNIKWEPNWFEDEDQARLPEIQTVASSEKVNKIQMQPLNVQLADDYHKQPTYGAASSTSSSHARSDAGTSQFPSAPSHHVAGSSGRSSDKMPYGHTADVTESVLPGDRQNWNMEFKDATAAAQAAAESAERASMAARAAAELSGYSRMNNDNSFGSPSSYLHAQGKDERFYGNAVKQKPEEANSSINEMAPSRQGSGGYANVRNNMSEGGLRSPREKVFGPGVQSGSEREEFRETKINSYSADENLGRQSMHSHPAQTGYEASSNVSSSPYSKVYVDEPVENPFHEETSESGNFATTLQSQFGAFGNQYNIFSNSNDEMKQHNFDLGSSGNFSRTATDEDWQENTHYNSGFYDDEEEIKFKHHGEGVGDLRSDDILVGTCSKTDDLDAEERNIHSNIAPAFDNSGSEDDECVLDSIKNSYYPNEPSESLSSHYSFNEDKASGIWVNQSSVSPHAHPGLDVSESFRNSPLYSKLSEPVPVSFDSDGASSESENELKDESTDAVPRSSEYEDSVTVSPVNSRSQNSAGAFGLPLQSPYASSESQHETQSTPESGSLGLNLGMLPGGRRNRSRWSPPYTRPVVDSSLRPSEPFEDVFGASKDTSSALTFDVPSEQMEKKRLSGQTGGVKKYFDTIGDESEVVIAQKASTYSESPVSAKTRQNFERTIPKDPTGYFDSADSTSEEDIPVKPVTNKTFLDAGLSRRTKAASSRSVAKSKPSFSSGYDAEKINSSLTSHATDLNSSLEGPSGTSVETSRPRPSTKFSKDFSSLTRETPRTPPKDRHIQGTSNSGERVPSRENSSKQPSHVHPNLPDFETLSARMQSLRTNRQ